MVLKLDWFNANFPFGKRSRLARGGDREYSPPFHAAAAQIGKDRTR